MQAVFVKDPGVIDYTPGSNVPAGAVVVLGGSLVCVAKQPLTANVLGALSVAGIYRVVQAAVTFTVGQAVYWDDDADPVGGTAGSGAAVENAALGIFMGYALGATEATDETVLVALRSVESSLAESLTLNQLGDVGTLAYGTGSLLVADGDSYEEQAVSGDGTLSDAGVLAITSFAAMPTVPSATVAATGSDQAGAALIATGFTLVTAADGTTGVKLPAAAAGKICWVKNRDTENQILKVYPNTDDTINALSANAALSMAAKTSAVFISCDGTAWYTIPLLPS